MNKVGLLDTSIQIDKVKMPTRKKQIDELMSDFDMTITTGFSLVEFKAVVIQQLITIHNQLRRRGATFTAVRDALIEKMHPQTSLRSHIFNNLIQVFARPGLLEEQNLKLAEKARLQIENIIVPLYDMIREDPKTEYLNKTRINCTRAEERPKKKGVAYDVNLPRCVDGKNKGCRVEDFIKEEAQHLLDDLKTACDNDEQGSDTRQLEKTRQIFCDVIERDRRLSVSDCRSCGDCLIAMEGRKAASHAVSSNAREWKEISSWLELEFLHVTYDGEQTR